MKIDQFEDILYEKDEKTGIVTVTLNRPERKNAMSVLTFLEIYYAVEAMENDDSAHVMVMTGAKDPNSNDSTKEAFSSGGYFNIKFREELKEKYGDEIDFTDIAQKKLTLKMWQFDKPVIAAINGLAIGAGFTMPLAGADFIYMSEHAWARLPFVNLSLIPEFAATYILPRLMGFQKAKELIYLGEKIFAKQALEWGLINKVLPHDELLPYAYDMAQRIIPPQGPGFSVRLAKKAMHERLFDTVSDSLDQENIGLNKGVATEDFIEAIVARQEKRPPVFKGK
jgi:2-(1,2-epoxy-1,2-dihydrophenyl)acetyl-CoA isomerase